MNNDLILRSKLEGMHLFVSPGEKPDKETVGWNRAIDAGDRAVQVLA